MFLWLLINEQYTKTPWANYLQFSGKKTQNRWILKLTEAQQWKKGKGKKVCFFFPKKCFLYIIYLPFIMLGSNNSWCLKILTKWACHDSLHTQSNIVKISDKIFCDSLLNKLYILKKPGCNTTSKPFTLVWSCLLQRGLDKEMHTVLIVWKTRTWPT